MSETERRKAARDWYRDSPKVTSVISRKRELSSGFNASDIIEIAAGYGDFVYDSALLEAAGLVCHLCRQESTPVQLDGKWFHENPPMKCEASPIHERRALKGNG